MKSGFFHLPTSLRFLLSFLLAGFIVLLAGCENNQSNSSSSLEISSAPVSVASEEDKREIITLTDDKGRPIYDNVWLSNSVFPNMTDMLSEKLEEYRGRDVLFKVDFLILSWVSRASDQDNPSSGREELSVETVAREIESLCKKSFTKRPIRPILTFFISTGTFMKPLSAKRKLPT